MRDLQLKIQNGTRIRLRECGGVAFGRPSGRNKFGVELDLMSSCRDSATMAALSKVVLGLPG